MLFLSSMWGGIHGSRRKGLQCQVEITLATPLYLGGVSSCCDNSNDSKHFHIIPFVKTCSSWESLLWSEVTLTWLRYKTILSRILVATSHITMSYGLTEESWRTHVSAHSCASSCDSPWSNFIALTYTSETECRDKLILTAWYMLHYTEDHGIHAMTYWVHIMTYCVHTMMGVPSVQQKQTLLYLVLKICVLLPVRV